MNKDKEIIAKQDEIIKHLSKFATFNVDGINKRDRLESELAQLKAEAEKEVSDKNKTENDGN